LDFRVKHLDFSGRKMTSGLAYTAKKKMLCLVSSTTKKAMLQRLNCSMAFNSILTLEA